MDIQQILYFLEVVQSGNFSAAAENLYTTQSSVSKNIKSLEKELDVQLFDRSKRQIQLTEAGRLVLNDARAIAGAYNQLIHTVSNFQLQNQDILTIAGIPVMAQYNITGMLSVSNDRLAAVLPCNHPLNKKKQISISELRNENLLLLSKSTLHYDKITHICRQRGFEPQVVYTGTHMENILDLVSRNHGISLLMQHAAERLHHPGVVIIPLKEEFISTLTLACNDCRQLSPAGRSFWNYISRQVSRSL